MKFDKDFLFGVATSCYQIEGATKEDGRCDCIWDLFCREPGKVYMGHSGDLACDHYHRYKEDVELIRQLGAQVYRFSIAWPRIFPAEGQYNPKGMEFYKNLVKELKSKGIKSAATLYHWDLPVWVQDKGGWESRQCVDLFAEYARKCFEELGNDVDFWITHNEPYCASFLSYYNGEHAPGKEDLALTLRVAHNILLSHGESVRLYRKMGLKAPIGIALNLIYGDIIEDTYLNRVALNNFDGMQNRWFLEPLFKKCYPVDMVNLFAAAGRDFTFIKEGDFDIIGEPCDFLGVNFYNRVAVEYSSYNELLFGYANSDYPKTLMGWDIDPEGFVKLIDRLRKEYTDLPVIITENGSAWEDVIAPDGKIHDANRVDYMERHLESVSRMNEMGLNVAGYFAWSLMDNYEWARGYSRRFGIVYVDFETLERTPKDSYYRFKEIIAESGK